MVSELWSLSCGVESNHHSVVVRRAEAEAKAEAEAEARQGS